MKIVTLNRRVDLAAGVAVQAGAVMPPGKPRRFQIEAYDGGPLPVAGFDLPVIVDLATTEFPEAMPLLIDHEATVEATLGSTDLIENNGQTLNIAGIVTATSPKAVQVVEQHDKGQRWQASIGVRIGTLQEVQAGQVVVVNKQSFRGPVLVARNNQGFETSVLPAGADWTTTVNLAARAALLKGTATMPTFEEWLASLKVDAATLDEAGRAAFMQTYDAMQNPKPVAPVVAPPVAAQVPPVAPVVAPAMTAAFKKQASDDLLAEMRKTQGEEHRRVGQIETITVGHPDIRATAVEKGWSPMETENAVLKAKAKLTAPDNTRRGGGSMSGVTPEILTAAICQTRKIPGHEKQFKDEVLQAAHTQFRGGIGLQQLLLHAACLNGYDASPGERLNTNLKRVLQFAFPRQDEMKAAFSTVSLPGILSNVANKELLAGYEADAQLMLWKEVSDVKSVSDFKTVTAYRMLDNMVYEELGAGGKIKHGSIGEESYTRAAKTYAKMFSLTRTDIINDDLGAFDDLRKRLGMGAAQKLSDVFWTKFLDNSAFFTSGRGNYISGSTTNLGTDGVGLQLGLNAFRTLRSPTADGSKRVGGEPELLVVPTELSRIAESFHVLNNLAGGTAMADANIYARKYRPVVVPWLSDTSFTGYSTTAWYLFRNPAKYAPMVVSFLNGQEQPTVESADADFDTLGVDFRGYHDFGCDQSEYLAGCKSKGAA